MGGFINISAAVSPESFSINFVLMSQVSFSLTAVFAYAIFNLVVKIVN
jgi:hypothetical protein